MLVVGFQEITLQLQMSNESNLLELFIAPLSLIVPQDVKSAPLKHLMLMCECVGQLHSCGFGAK